MAEQQKHEPINDDMHQCIDIVYDKAPIQVDTRRYPWDYDSYSEYRKHRPKKTVGEYIVMFFEFLWEYFIN